MYVKFKDIRKIRIYKRGPFWGIAIISPSVGIAFDTMTYPEACNTARAIFRGRK